jgi:hypothetical protein
MNISVGNEIKNILPDEKPEKTTGRPQLFLTEKYLMVSCLSKDWMSVENVTQRIWFWFHMP